MREGTMEVVEKGLGDHIRENAFNFRIKLCQNITFNVFLWKIMENIRK